MLRSRPRCYEIPAWAVARLRPRVRKVGVLRWLFGRRPRPAQTWTPPRHSQADVVAPPGGFRPTHWRPRA